MGRSHHAIPYLLGGLLLALVAALLWLTFTTPDAPRETPEILREQQRKSRPLQDNQ